MKCEHVYIYIYMHTLLGVGVMHTSKNIQYHQPVKWQEGRKHTSLLAAWQLKHAGTVVERIHLVPQGAPQAGDPGALGVGRKLVRELGNGRCKAPAALSGRQVRGARGYAVDIGVGGVKADGPGREPVVGRVRRGGGNVVGHGVEELVGSRVEPADDVGADVLGVFQLHLLIFRVGG